MGEVTGIIPHVLNVFDQILLFLLPVGLVLLVKSVVCVHLLAFDESCCDLMEPVSIDINYINYTNYNKVGSKHSWPIN